MKRIWRWVLSLFRRNDRAERRREKAETDLNEERFGSLKAFKSIARYFRGQHRLEGGYPNMPRRQPCPQCGSWAKRERKTMAGAYYNCTRDKLIFLAVNRAAQVTSLEKLVAGVK